MRPSAELLASMERQAGQLVAALDAARKDPSVTPEDYCAAREQVIIALGELVLVSFGLLGGEGT